MARVSHFNAAPVPFPPPAPTRLQFVHNLNNFTKRWQFIRSVCVCCSTACLLLRFDIQHFVRRLGMVRQPQLPLLSIVVARNGQKWAKLAELGTFCIAAVKAFVKTLHISLSATEFPKYLFAHTLKSFSLVTFAERTHSHTHTQHTHRYTVHTLGLFAVHVGQQVCHLIALGFCFSAVQFSMRIVEKNSLAHNRKYGTLLK